MMLLAREIGVHWKEEERGFGSSSMGGPGYPLQDGMSALGHLDVVENVCDYYAMAQPQATI
jgi:hypothetical protein